MPTAKLALENGLVFTGSAFGATGQRDGEVCFNTSMTGYQEILTDPSYCGQIVTMTYPLIGNYGINPDDAESAKPWLSGFVCRELSSIVSNYRHTQSLDDFLAQHGIIGLQGVDTRAIVLATRSQGAMKGIISTTDLDDESLIAKAKASPGLVGRDVAREVMPSETRSWSDCNANEWRFLSGIQTSSKAKHVVAMDFGMKWNIARCLAETGCKVTVVPGSTKAEEILAHQPDGVFISNGPGDPEPLTYAVSAIKNMIGKVPIFGICLGHQLIGQAFGGKTFKLKFGHRGANQPVLNQLTGKVEITTQNHGFAVDPASLPDSVIPTHINLNDQTLEGLRHRDLPVFSVQYHPEASAGPHDSQYLFAEFVEMMDKHPVR
jgi:carbamoyl-phosphate synthase small subunit